MLAYDPGIPISYDAGLTALSLVIAIAITCVGLAFAVYSSIKWRAAVGGAIVGLGIAAMHYLGISAVEIPGRIIWSTDLVVASIILGVAFGVAAFLAAKQYKGFAGTTFAALLLTTAIVSHHFVAMGAIEITGVPRRVFTLPRLPVASPGDVQVHIAPT